MSDGAREFYLQELVNTEHQYVNNLKILEAIYVIPLSSSDIITEKDSRFIFAHINTIKAINGEMLKQLEETIVDKKEGGKSVGQIMLRLAPFLKTYTQYYNNYENVFNYCMKLKQTNLRYKAYIEKTEKEAKRKGLLDMISYLIMPIQRIPRYNMLLKEIVEHTSPDNSDYESLVKALETTKSVTTYFNEKVRQQQYLQRVTEIKNEIQCPSSFEIVEPGRIYVADADLCITTSKEDNKPYHVYLFSDLILLTSKNKYVSHLCLKRAPVPWIKSANDRPDLKNAILLVTKERPIFLIAKDPEQKLEWFDSMFNVIDNLINKIPTLQAQPRATVQLPKKVKPGFYSILKDVLSQSNDIIVPSNVRDTRMSTGGITEPVHNNASAISRHSAPVTTTTTSITSEAKDKSTPTETTTDKTSEAPKGTGKVQAVVTSIQASSEQAKREASEQKQETEINSTSKEKVVKKVESEAVEVANKISDSKEVEAVTENAGTTTAQTNNSGQESVADVITSTSVEDTTRANAVAEDIEPKTIASVETTQTAAENDNTTTTTIINTANSVPITSQENVALTQQNTTETTDDQSVSLKPLTSTVPSESPNSINEDNSNKVDDVTPNGVLLLHHQLQHHHPSSHTDDSFASTPRRRSSAASSTSSTSVNNTPRDYSTSPTTPRGRLSKTPTPRMENAEEKLVELRAKLRPSPRALDLERHNNHMAKIDTFNLPRPNKIVISGGITRYSVSMTNAMSPRKMNNVPSQDTSGQSNELELALSRKTLRRTVDFMAAKKAKEIEHGNAVPPWMQEIIEKKRFSRVISLNGNSGATTPTAEQQQSSPSSNYLKQKYY